MDTFKDKLELDRIMATGDPPWQVWREDRMIEGQLAAP